MKVSIEVEDTAWLSVPGLEALTRTAITAAISGSGIRLIRDPFEIDILFTDDSTIRSINAEWRGKDAPTNVLSFPAPEDMPVPAGEVRPLGDIVMAYGTIEREAARQGKPLPDHTAHLIVHGVLHLLGYDHEDDAEAGEMERLEIGILKGLGISNPYE
jgi:probable rRNA maturation factor